MLGRYISQLLYEDRCRMAEINSRLLATCKLHEQTFLPYKNYCGGVKDIVMCGAGPSLNDFQPIEDAVYIAVNRAFLFEKVKFDFIFAQDYEGINMVLEQLLNYRGNECVKFLGTQNVKNKIIPESLIIQCNAKKFDTDWYIYGNGCKGEMTLDLESRPLCNMMNVGQSVMQLCLYMNPRRIYIVGCDMSGNHFSPGNQSDEEVKKQGILMEKTFESRRKDLIRRWIEIKDFAAVHYPNTEIISINPVGLKGIFNDIYQ